MMMPSKHSLTAAAKKKVHHPKSTPPTLQDDGRDDIETAVANHHSLQNHHSMKKGDLLYRLLRKCNFWMFLTIASVGMHIYNSPQTINDVPIQTYSDMLADQMTPKARLNEKHAIESTWLPYTERPFDYMLQHYWAKDGNCRTLATYLRDRLQNDDDDANNTMVTSQPSASHYPFVHTELFMPHNKSLTIDPRKEQLPVLSFLATQHPSLTLILLISGGKDAKKRLPQWLQILLKHEVYITLIHWRM